MQPDSLSFGAVRGDDGKDRSGDTDWIEEITILLGGGDITRRDAILWGYALKECEPWLKYQERVVIFREVIIHLLMGETDAQKKKRQEDAFCKACRAAKKNINCEGCSKTIQVAGETEHV